MTALTEGDIEPLPCPFCGKVGVTFMVTGGVGKWGACECDYCGARGSEVRVGYRPVAECRSLALAEWNHRAGNEESDE